MPNITARDVASILGVNKFESAWQLLENKIEKKYPFFGNKFTEHGKKYEPVAIKLYEKMLENTVDSNQKNLKHPVYPWLTGRMDGVTSNNCIVEIKCPWNRKPANGKIESIPIEYWIQCQVYMNLINAEIAHYVEYHVKPDAPLDGSEGLLCYLPVARDREWWNSALPKICNFYDELSFWYEKESLDEHSIRKAEIEWSEKFREKEL
jgi:putative phage-type endonuclease